MSPSSANTRIQASAQASRVAASDAEHHRLSTLLAAILVSILAVATKLQAAEYAIFDLGTLAGSAETTSPGSIAFSITEDGRICGLSVDSTDEHDLRAVLWDGGALTDLGVLGVDVHSMAFALNDAGVSVGLTFTLGETTTQAVRWIGGSAAGLGTWAARDVNLAGTIVGEMPGTSSGAFAHAARWVSGSLIDLGTLGGLHSSASAVNDADWVVGMSFTASNAQRRAFLWRNGTLSDLGTLGGAHSHAYDISNSGYVVGMSQNTLNKTHAFRYTLNSQGQVLDRLDLGELGGEYSQAFGVNDQGEVVGTSDDRAFLWAADVAAMVDVNTLLPPNSSWHLSHAMAINNDGVIVGRGVHNGLPRAFMLVPLGVVGDLDGDGDVDGFDLALLLGAWGPCAGCPADLDASGIVNGFDLAMLLAAWS